MSEVEVKVEHEVESAVKEAETVASDLSHEVGEHAAKIENAADDFLELKNAHTALAQDVASIKGDIRALYDRPFGASIDEVRSTVREELEKAVETAKSVEQEVVTAAEPPPAKVSEPEPNEPKRESHGVLSIFHHLW